MLYLGPASGTSLDRARAFERLGHHVELIDPRSLLPATVWVDRFTWKLGGDWFGPLLTGALRRRLAGRAFDLCHVDGGEWVTPGVIALLRGHARAIVNYNVDDPTGPRDGPRFRAYRRSVSHYDVCAVVRPENIDEARALGARHVLHVFRSADEVNHAPRALTEEDRARWGSDVLFLGTWFPERGPFLRDLVRRGVPLTIRGSNWHRAPEWRDLQPHWRGSGIFGDDYAKAIQCATVCLGLLSKGNRDLHTQRSLEIPALGGLLCAERTTEHSQIYDEGSEAVFWEGTDECAAVCSAMLADRARRDAIAAAGHVRVAKNGHFNEPTMQRIVDAALPD